MYLQFWFYLDLCKTNIFLSSSPHCDGNSYADKLKNPHTRKNQQKLKNQHAGNQPLATAFSQNNFNKLTSMCISVTIIITKLTKINDKNYTK